MARYRALIPKKFRLLLGVTAIVFIVLLQLSGQLDTTQPEVVPAATGEYQVARFIDGDTFVASLGGKQETIRLIGIDTPEARAPNRPVQCYGPAAAAYIKTLIQNQPIRLQTDPLTDDRDRYGRLLRHAYLPGERSIGEEIVSQGYGFVYTVFPFSKSQSFVAAEDEAKASYKGLWGNCSVSEKDGRKQTNPAGN